jgi:hypothetical protein
MKIPYYKSGPQQEPVSMMCFVRSKNPTRFSSDGKGRPEDGGFNVWLNPPVIINP